MATVGGAFVFGYKALEYSLDQPDITKVSKEKKTKTKAINTKNEVNYLFPFSITRLKQMLSGLLLAIIVAIADLYFLFKKLMKLEENENKKA